MFGKIWDWFVRRLRQMLYEDILESYAPPHQLMFLFDAEKGIGKSVEWQFSDALFPIVYYGPVWLRVKVRK